MAQIEVKQLTPDELDKMGVFEWPVWEKEASTFMWSYQQGEEFYVIEGKAIIKIGEQEYAFGQGDFVIVDAGVECERKVAEAIKKHYHMR